MPGATISGLLGGVALPCAPVGKRGQTYQERPRADWIEVGTIPAIISPEVFAQVEEKLARNQQLSQRNANAISCGRWSVAVCVVTAVPGAPARKGLCLLRMHG